MANRSASWFALCSVVWLVCVLGCSRPRVEAPPIPRSAAHAGSIATTAGTPRLITQVPHSKLITAVAFSADGRYVATGSQDATALLWFKETGQIVRSFSTERGVVALALSADNQYLAASIDDGTIRIWSVDTGREVSCLRGHTQPASAIAFSDDRLHLLSVSTSLGNKDNTARMWSLQTGKELRRFSTNQAGIRAAALSSDGSRLLTGSTDGTVALWDFETGRRLRTFSGFEGAVTAVAFRPHGTQTVLAAGDGASIREWSTASGKELRYLGRFASESEVVFLATAPDGYLGALTSRREIYVWTGAEQWVKDGDELVQVIDSEHLFRLEGAWSESRCKSGPCFAFSQTGGEVAWAHATTARVTSLQTRKEVMPVTQAASHTLSAAFSPDGHALAIGVLGGIWTWDTASNREPQKVVPERGGCLYPSPSFDRGRILCSTLVEPLEIRAWSSDARTLVETYKIPHKHGAYIANSPAYSPDGTRVLVGLTRRENRLGASIFSVQSQQETHFLEAGFRDPAPEPGTGLCFTMTAAVWSPTGQNVLTSGMNCRRDFLEQKGFESCSVSVHVWSADTGTLLNSLDGSVGHAFVPGSSTVLVTSRTGEVGLWDYQLGTSVRPLGVKSKDIQHVSLSPDGTRVLVNDRGVLYLRSLKDGTEVSRFEVNTSVGMSAFSPDGRHLVTVGSVDEKVRIFDVKTGQALAQLVSFSNGTWAVVDSQGRYDASNAGEIDGLHWVIGLEPVALDQLKERYYEPKLLAKLLGYSDEPLRDVGTFTDLALFPEMEVRAPEGREQALTIRLKNRGGGIGRVVIRINGKEIDGAARGRRIEPDAKEGVVVVPVADHPYLRRGEDNRLEVKVFNAAGYLSSRGKTITYKAPGVRGPPPSLWAVVAGVSDYEGESIDLRYAGKDAVDIAGVLHMGATRLFGPERTHISLLTTEKVSGAASPTKQNIIAALEAVARGAGSGDILIVYLAGHGVVHGGSEGDFYYLARNARTDNLNDPAVRKSSALSTTELSDLIKRIAATKQVLIADTCGAGRLLQQLSGQRSVPSSQALALERLKDRTGFFVLAGSAADAVSYEANRYGQGLLTYSLLNGISGAALRDDQFVDVGTLFNHAVDQVPQLASGINGIQRPSIATPRGGASFDIGQLIAEDRKHIALARPLPMVLRTSFQDEVGIVDSLHLTEQVNQGLRSLARRGPAPTLIFVDASDVGGAYAIAGRYAVAGKDITVQVSLARGADSADRFETKGDAKELPALVERIVTEIEQRIQRAPH